ncbi:hypothetical protein AWC18_04165 [Mycolicibacter nonchromogenicus]|uniref:Uncharacterized protein n=1 Tax=Mycolicibacter nonchromogenicus TaxID=1782 RepID=A0A1X1ZK18_MYCNO|nr:hypothetical protein [Mycolicibacter nonchromogenicus]ORW23672.1 hypothetical protein AWC18_04165 [Mycolicibacter nonchromogenicus]
MSDEPISQFVERVFGQSFSGRPPVPFMQLLRAYADEAEVFAGAPLEDEGYEALWIAGEAVGWLSVEGNDDDAPITGAVSAIASLGPIKLGAEVTDSGLRARATPSITLAFSDGTKVQVGSDHHNSVNFISGLLERLRGVSSR